MDSDFEIILGLVDSEPQERTRACDALLAKYEVAVTAYIRKIAPSMSREERAAAVDEAFKGVVGLAATKDLDDCDDLRPILIRCAKRVIVSAIGAPNAGATAVSVIGTKAGDSWNRIGAVGKCGQARRLLREEIRLLPPIFREILRVLNNRHPQPVGDEELHAAIIAESSLVPNLLEVIEARSALSDRVASILSNTLKQQ
jgi:hypothetical protein